MTYRPVLDTLPNWATDVAGATSQVATIIKAPWCSGLTCHPVTVEIAGSNPAGVASYRACYSITRFYLNSCFMKAVSPPALRICAGGLSGARFSPCKVNPFVKLVTSPVSRSILAVSPSSNIFDTPSQISTGKPMFIAFLKKRRDIESATITLIPSAWKNRGAGRLDPHPQLRPAIIILPFFTFDAQPGRHELKQ